MTPEEVAKDAVYEWLLDGMEFCYIYEREDLELSNDEMAEAYVLAGKMIKKLSEEFLD